MVLAEKDQMCTMEDQAQAMQQDHSTEGLLIIRLEVLLTVQASLFKGNVVYNVALLNSYLCHIWELSLDSWLDWFLKLQSTRLG